MNFFESTYHAIMGAAFRAVRGVEHQDFERLDDIMQRKSNTLIKLPDRSYINFKPLDSTDHMIVSRLSWQGKVMKSMLESGLATDPLLRLNLMMLLPQFSGFTVVDVTSQKHGRDEANPNFI